MTKFRLPIVAVYKDIVNYLDWINTINNEKRNPKSKYNKFNFGHNYFYIIYTIVTLSEEDRVLPDDIKKQKVIETLRPVNLYLDEELGFAEYLVPEFSQFYTYDNEPTLSYGIIYRFAFKRLSLKWVITRTGALLAAIWLVKKFDLITLLKNLI